MTAAPVPPSADRLAGKVAIVTGAGSGIGRAIALRLIEEGAEVVAADVDEVGLRATLDSAVNPDAMLTQRTDVSVPEEVFALVELAVNEFGSLTTMVNNAAISIPGTVVDTSWEDFENTLAVNVRGVYAGCKYAIPAMLDAGGGSIINIGSVNSLVAERQLSAYTTSTRCSSSSTAAALPKRSGKRAAAIWANRPAEKACSVSMYTTAPSSPPIDAGSVAATLAAKQNCVLPHPGGPTS